MALHKVRIVMSGISRGEVFLDEQKVRGVKAIEFKAGVDCVTEVRITLNAGEAVVEGVADVTAIGDTERKFEKAA